MDREWPTRRPEGANDGTQAWRDLAFLHYRAPVAALQPLLPRGLELDLYQGEAYVGVVPFLMRDIAPTWWPRALAFNFHETNVRLYVTHRGRDPGVYFLSLDASSRLAVAAARTGWGLPYFHARMRGGREGMALSYASERPRATLSLDARVGPALPASKPDTAEFFFLERYLLYVERKGRIHRGQVHHPPYPAHALTDVRAKESLLRAAGIDGAGGSVDPDFAHYSPGVDVEVFGTRPVD